MPISVRKVAPDEARRIIKIAEGHFEDVKAIDIVPSKLTKHISAFANADGGDLYIGIDESGQAKRRTWRGFKSVEDGNAHVQTFETAFPLGAGFEYEFLESETASHRGFVLHAQIGKARGIVRTPDNKLYKRRGAGSVPVVTNEDVRRLEYEKGIVTFEDELVNCPLSVVTGSQEIARFLRASNIRTKPQAWLEKQFLVRDGKPTVACVVLFADDPQAILNKRCGIKVARYRGVSAVREALDGAPVSIDGSAHNQITAAVNLVKEIAERMPKVGSQGLDAIEYPRDALNEIITNAVLHRDYSIANDVQITVFDNRIEVLSPGPFPANVTPENCRKTRFLRNGTLVRYLNKFPNAPNLDYGEGLDTAFRALNKLGLKDPIIEQPEGAVRVTIRHEKLAAPEEAIMEHLRTHPTINNTEAREVTHVGQAHQIKAIFGRMVAAGMIEQVPGTRTSSTAYQLKRRR